MLVGRERKKKEREVGKVPKRTSQFDDQPATAPLF
jgi:hypothetical protein